MSRDSRRNQRKKREAQAIIDAAQDVVGLNSMVGIDPGDFLKAIRSTLYQLIRRPEISRREIGALIRNLSAALRGTSDFQPASNDKRFQDPGWSQDPLAYRALQCYLVMSDALDHWADQLDIDFLERLRMDMVIALLKSTIAPSNFLLTNPPAKKKAMATRGGSLLKGMRNLVNDIRFNKGMPSQVDKSQYEVGVNLATCKGEVIFRNEILELIQYYPEGSQVHSIPLFCVPPQVNRYYLFDMSPEKSFFKYMVAQGFQLFTVVWCNPSSKQQHLGIDDYISALVEAKTVMQQVTGQTTFNLMGACTGGITASIFAGYLHASGEEVVNTMTLPVCVMRAQRSDTEITAFSSDETIESARSRSGKKGVMEGRNLSFIFNLMRPNDLIWNYVVNNYLMGNDPPAFDLLYWNNDSNDLPAKLHSDFLDILKYSPLATPDRYAVLGVPINILDIPCDKYLVAGLSDHITPWPACYRSTQFLAGDKRFVLAKSGHIQTLAHVPDSPRSYYYTNDNLPESSDDWLNEAAGVSGSWWQDYTEWLKLRSGPLKRARKTMGSKKYPPLCAAPGTYVLQ